MKRREYAGRHRHHPAIAMASSCDDCAHLIGDEPAWAPGRHTAIVHLSHVGDLEALGWVLTNHGDEPPDIVCPHYHAMFWEGDDDDPRTA
jgi:hypothetical protein